MGGPALEVKTRLKQAFKTRVLAPMIDRLGTWERMVVDIPEATCGGTNSPVRFNIPREGIKLEGDHPPLPGILAQCRT